MGGPATQWSIGECHTRGLAEGPAGFLGITQLTLWNLTGGGQVSCTAQARHNDSILVGGEAPKSPVQLGFQAPGDLLRAVIEHQGVPFLVALDADGSTGVSINQKSLLQLIDTSQRSVVQTRQLERPANSLTVLDSGKRIIVSHTDGTLSVLSTPQLDWIHQYVPLLGRAGSIHGVQVRAVPGKPRFLSRSDGGLLIQQFEVDTLRPHGPPLRHQRGVHWFCADDTFLFSIDQTEDSPGTLRVWSLRTGREIVPGLHHPAPLLWASILNQGSRIATADASGTVRRWVLEH
ncbi:MAG: WD40 repeat domain-containing protein [Verrucomicrobiales bacterium]